MTPVMQSVQEISALHEAAHCVVKWRLTCDFYPQNTGAGFDAVALRTDDEIAAGPYLDIEGRQRHCTGISEMSAFQNAGMLDDNVPDFATNTTRKKMGHDIVVALAGPLAEAKVRGCSADSLFERPQAGFQDHQRALQLIVCMNLKPEDQVTKYNQLRRQTEEYLSNAEVWKTICALAKALLSTEGWHLTGNQALPIMVAAWDVAIAADALGDGAT